MSEPSGTLDICADRLVVLSSRKVAFHLHGWLRVVTMFDHSVVFIPFALSDAKLAASKMLGVARIFMSF